MKRIILLLALILSMFLMSSCQNLVPSSSETGKDSGIITDGSAGSDNNKSNYNTTKKQNTIEDNSEFLKKKNEYMIYHSSYLIKNQVDSQTQQTIQFNCSSILNYFNSSTNINDLEAAMDLLMWNYEFYVAQYCRNNMTKMNTDCFHKDVLSSLINKANTCIKSNIYNGTKEQYDKEMNEYNKQLQTINAQIANAQRQGQGTPETLRIRRDNVLSNMNSLSIRWNNKIKAENAWNEILQTILKHLS